MEINLFRKKDPVCGMKEEKGKGINKNGRWFCSENCVREYEKRIKPRKKSCCH